MSLNPNYESELVSEDEVRAALRCHQIDADTFAARVLARSEIEGLSVGLLVSHQ